MASSTSKRTDGMAMPPSSARERANACRTVGTRRSANNSSASCPRPATPPPTPPSTADSSTRTPGRPPPPRRKQRGERRAAAPAPAHRPPAGGFLQAPAERPHLVHHFVKALDPPPPQPVQRAGQGGVLGPDEVGQQVQLAGAVLA